MRNALPVGIVLAAKYAVRIIPVTIAVSLFRLHPVRCLLLQLLNIAVTTTAIVINTTRNRVVIQMSAVDVLKQPEEAVVTTIGNVEAVNVVRTIYAANALPLSLPPIGTN